jgi:hypothetical protein
MMHNHTAHAHSDREATDPTFVLSMGTTGRGRSRHGGGLAVLAQRSHRRLQVLEETVPDNGAAVLNHWDNEGIHDDS